MHARGGFTIVGDNYVNGLYYYTTLADCCRTGLTYIICIVRVRVHNKSRQYDIAAASPRKRTVMNILL